MTLERELQNLAGLGFATRNSSHLRSVALSAMAQPNTLQCMRHPLGFYHILLHKENSISIRLHYWPSENRPQSSAITPYHDHVWSLQSCVLAGRLENLIFSVKAHRAGSYELATIKQIEGVDSVVPTSERVSILISETSSYSSGDFYSIEPGIFHSTNVPHGTSTATLVRAEVLRVGGPRTLVPPGYSGQAPARAYLTEEQAATIIQEIRSLLSSESG